MITDKTDRVIPPPQNLAELNEYKSRVRGFVSQMRNSYSVYDDEDNKNRLDALDLAQATSLIIAQYLQAIIQYEATR